MKHDLKNKMVKGMLEIGCPMSKDCEMKILVINSAESMDALLYILLCRVFESIC